MRKTIHLYLFFSILLLVTCFVKTKTSYEAFQFSKDFQESLWFFNQKNFTKKSHFDLIIRIIFGFDTNLYYLTRKNIDRCLLWPIFNLNNFHIYLFLKSLKLKKIYRYFPTLKKIIDKISIRASNSFIEYFIFSLFALIAYKLNLLQNFAFSLIFILTFKHSEYKSKIDSIILLILTHLLLSIYFGKNFSFIASFFSILLFKVYKKTYRYLLIIFIFGIFISNTLLDSIIKNLVVIIDIISSMTTIDQMSSTFFLFITTLIYYFRRDKKIIYLYILIHANWSFTPELYLSK